MAGAEKIDGLTAGQIDDAVAACKTPPRPTPPTPNPHLQRNTAERIEQTRRQGKLSDY